MLNFSKLRGVLLIILFFTCSGGALAQSPHNHRHSFADAEKWKAIFDDPARDIWQKPQEVIAALALAPDATVADLGAGTGYFAMRLAAALPQGRVFAVDIEPGMVQHVAARAKHNHAANLVAVQGATDDPRLPGKANLILLVNVYHHIAQREKYFAGLRDALKPGGRIAVIDFTADSPVGPPRSARISAARVKDEMRNAGFSSNEEHGFLPHQYFLVFTPGRP